jgi:hypothetical protein
MDLDSMIVEIGYHLSNSSEAVYTDEEVGSAIALAVADISRIMPAQKLLDITLKFSYNGEAVDTDADTVTVPITLDHSMIKPSSESLTSSDGTTTYIRDTDYSMDYVNGILTPLADGSLVKDTSYLISYTLLKNGFSISSIVDGLLIISQIEYPAGETPQKKVSWTRYGDYVFIDSGVTGSQEQLVENKHVFLYYLSDYDAPTASDGEGEGSTGTDGTYPLFLDSVVMLGAEAYLLFARANKMVNLATTSISTGEGYVSSGSSKVDTTNRGGSSVAPTYGRLAEIEAANGMTYSKLAEACLSQARMKQQEFWNVLRDKTQMRKETATTDVRQIKS